MEKTNTETTSWRELTTQEAVAALKMQFPLSSMTDAEWAQAIESVGGFKVKA
jgi:hypothetical protein